jgi:uncharacterized YigZ family protein
MAFHPLTVPLAFARAETKVSNSHFIASLDYADSVEVAKAFVARIRGEFPDASHHVPSFIVGGGNSRIEFCSDDGEPSGTAGRPLLAVLKGSGLGNVAVVVTRYFGGTLLGTGGLVKAYAEAGKKVIEAAPRAQLVETISLELELPYRLFDPFGRLACDTQAAIVKSGFGETVSLSLEIPSDRLKEFSDRVAELGAGSLELRRTGMKISRVALGPWSP